MSHGFLGPMEAKSDGTAICIVVTGGRKGPGVEQRSVTVWKLNKDRRFGTCRRSRAAWLSARQAVVWREEVHLTASGHIGISNFSRACLPDYFCLA